MHHLLAILLLTSGAVLAVLTLYDLALAVAALPTPRSAPPAKRLRRFAILIAAHDEEAVIGHAVRGLFEQTHPRELFDVHVVADRCSDGTAAAARAAGAIVHERSGAEHAGGKPAALRWLVQRISDSGEVYDAACVFDADNLASPGFLAAMNRHLEAGARCVQGYLDTKNPQDTWVCGAIAVAYWTTNRLWQAPRHRLGLSCALGGTGFCLDWDTARRLAWRNDCLTEDLDLQVQLVLEGERVRWAHDARAYDEKPLGMRASCNQRLRWMRGHWDVARRTFFPLLWRAIRRADPVALDSAVYVLQPLRTVVGAATVLAATAAMLLGWADVPAPWMLAFVVIPYFGYLAHFCFAGVPALGLLLERVPLRYWRYYPAAFVFGLTWIPLAAWGILTSRRTAWSHTRHQRGMSLAERLGLDEKSGVQPHDLAPLSADEAS